MEVGSPDSGQFEEVAKALRVGYGLNVAELFPVAGGLDPVAQTFRAATANGDFFIKARPTVERGAILARFLQQSGIDSVVAPLPANSGDLSFALLNGVLLVYPFIPGANGFDRRPERQQWEKLGAALRRIHDSAVPAEIAKELGQETFATPDVDAFLQTVDRLLRDAGRDEPELALQSVIREREGAIRAVVAQQRLLGDECRRTERPLVPCHADLHVGNVLIDDDSGVHIVDWDQPRMAPRECDLLFFCDGGILNLHGSDEEASFFAGYGAQATNATLLRYYRYTRTLEDLISFAKQAVGGFGYSAEARMEAVTWFERQFAARWLR